MKIFKKHAYLIIAHNNIGILNILLEMIDDPRNDIYLLIDKKSRLKNTDLYICKKSNLFRLKPIINIQWGHFSQIEAELYLMKKASSKESYAYYHLLSGSDLPLHSQDEIHNFFIEHNGTEFIGFASGKDNEQDCRRKIMKYYFFPYSCRCKKGKKLFLRILSKISEFCINAILKRKEEICFKKGCNWFSMTNDCCNYIISKENFIRKRFRYTLCADEIFIQSLVFNSEFYKKCAKMPEHNMGMREIDWTRGRPYTWTINDKEQLDKSNKLFARKFSETQMDIALFLKEKIMKADTTIPKKSL